jgi:PAS domain-containing protein
VHHRPLLEALPELRGQGFDALLMGVLRTGQPYRGEEVAATFNRGSSRETIYFNFVYSPLRGVSGRVEGIAVTAFDVTEQVLARERAAQPTQAA